MTVRLHFIWGGGCVPASEADVEQGVEGNAE